jgi:hypothetical protein
MASRLTKKRWALSAAGAGLCWLIVLNCAVDDRKVHLADSNAGPPSLGGAQTATGTLQALFEVHPPSVDLGAVTTGFASRSRLKIVNTGTGPLTAPQAAWAAGNPPDYQVVQNQCSNDLAPGDSCGITVQLVPSHPGVLQASLQVSSGGNPPLVVPFTGQGFAAGNLILAPVTGSFEDFGGVLVGSPHEGTFSIMNPGTTSSGALTLQTDRPEFVLAAPNSGECRSGVTDLAPGQSCNLRIDFTPGDRGPLESTLTGITPGAGAVSLDLTGAGLVPGVLTPSSANVDFAGVVLGSSGSVTVHFQNQGDEPLQIGGARLDPAGSGEFSIQTSTCGAGTSLAAGDSCDVALQFRPTTQGEESSANLVVDVTGSDSLTVALVGHGLAQGTLAVVASNPGDEDFGDVLLSQLVTHVFQVSNPGAQSSGVLTVTPSGIFTLTDAPQPGDCVDGTTSLATGESCTVRLNFQPTQRQAESGALTISSALAGAARLDLKGRGIAPAKFDGDQQANFGTVLTNATAQRPIVVKNAGDQPLPPPMVAITSSDPSQAAAFTLANGCTAPLAFGDQCTLTLTFAPTVAVPYAATVQLNSDPGGSASVLLVGQALAPGSLVVAASGSADFGDVPLGTNQSQSFTISNPGGVAAGQLTISTDDPHFLVNPGNCNQGPPGGLVDGASCTFSIAFTPDSSNEVASKITVQSSGAGRAGLQIQGRGRTPAVLAAAGNQDLGRGSIGRALTAANQFAWTVTNNGDLPSGTLHLTRGAVTEFQISGDTCSNTQVPGHGTCQMQISFVAAEPPGARTENITVTDTASNKAVSLALTAVSVRVANPGQSCINADCASGVCTAGVCCDRACDQTCQQCSATGVCADESSQQQCGNGAARCFGVNQCALPAGQACGADSDCGTGLLCKQCAGGGKQCTLAAGCCGGCPGEQTCVNGSCSCAANQIDCGGGLCIPKNTANVCCPVSPSCPTNLPGCTNDGRCVQCTTNAQCGACSTCNTATNTCTPRARGTSDSSCPQGQLCNGNGACFAPQCTPNSTTQVCGQCNTCNNNFNCVAGNNGTPCSGNGTCQAGQCQPGAGSACQQGGPPCANGLTCTGGRCAMPAPPPPPVAQCTPGQTVCVDGQNVKLCSPTGTFGAPLPCLVQCVGGRCVDPVHDSTLVGCDLANQIVCNTGSTQCSLVTADPGESNFQPAACTAIGVSGFEVVVQCDGPSDCAGQGQVCCIADPGLGTVRVTCVDAADCVSDPFTDGRGTARTLVCDPAVIPSKCAAGTFCMQSTVLGLNMQLSDCQTPGETF